MTIKALSAILPVTPFVAFAQSIGVRPVQSVDTTQFASDPYLTGYIQKRKGSQ